MAEIQGIRVKGSEIFKGEIQKILNCISEYPKYLNYVKENVYKINEVKFNGGADASNKRVCLTSRHIDFTLIYNASGIIHEAAHIEDFSRRNLIGKLFFKGRNAELYALKKQRDFLDETHCPSEIEFINETINKLETKDYKFGDSMWRWVNLGMNYAGD